MTDPLVCRHCQLERHIDCAEQRCECTCRRPPAPPVRKGRATAAAHERPPRTPRGLRPGGAGRGLPSGPGAATPTTHPTTNGGHTNE